jgi:hypothetical protein
MTCVDKGKEEGRHQGPGLGELKDVVVGKLHGISFYAEVGQPAQREKWRQSRNGKFFCYLVRLVVYKGDAREAIFPPRYNLFQEIFLVDGWV